MCSHSSDKRVALSSLSVKFNAPRNVSEHSHSMRPSLLRLVAQQDGVGTPRFPPRLALTALGLSFLPREVLRSLAESERQSMLVQRSFERVSDCLTDATVGD